MVKKEIVQRYSCVRKWDVMTFSAVCFFFLIVVAELYLVFYVPVQLQKEDVLQKHIARERVITILDSQRQRMFLLHKRTAKPDNLEIVPAKQILDDYAQYARNNLEQLTLAEMLELIQLVTPFEKLIHSWGAKQFIFREQKSPAQNFFRNLEKKYNL